MAFVENWVETDPDGSVITVSVLDDWIRKTKVATRERMEGDAAFNLTGLIEPNTWATGPVPKQGSARAWAVTAANLGTVPLQDGRMAITTDTNRLYHMRGTGYVELDYLSKTAGGVVAGSTTFSSPILGTLGTAAQPNITSLGALVSLAVGNVTSTGAIVGLTLQSTSGGNVTIGPISTQLRITRQSAETVGILGESNAFGNLIANQLTGTLQTAAQPNITSLGTLSGLVINATGGFIANTATSTSGKWIRLSNTGGDGLWGLESSVGGSQVFIGTLAYSMSMGTANATALHLATNNTVRQTIDSAGVTTFANTVNVPAFHATGTGTFDAGVGITGALSGTSATFSGTVTAANFVGPTTIDANNLTGTTLNAGVIHSSLKDLGALTGLNVTGVAGAASVVLNTTTGAVADNIQIFFQRGGVGKWRIGTNIDGLGTDSFNIYNETAFALTINRSTNVVSAPSGFSGNITGNLTGTVLTAAQANITSLGALTSLIVTNGIVARGFTAFPSGIGLELGYDGTAGFVQGYNRTGSVFIPIRLFGLGIEFWSDGLAVRAQFDSSNRFLVGTTSTTGVTAGGIRAAGDSVFDGLITSNLTSSVIFTSTIAGVNPRIFRINNTSGATDFGTSGNVASTVFANDTAYSSVFGSQGARSLHLATNGTVRFTIDSAGAVSALGAWTFNSTVGGITTLTATTINGTLTSTGTVSTTAAVAFSMSGQGTGFQYGQFSNTGNTTFLGIESSAGAAIFAGTGVYATVLGTTSARSLQFVTNNVLRMTIDSAGAGNFVGTLTAGGFSGTILTAAQANITSVGTLTALTISGTLDVTGVTSHTGNVRLVTNNTTKIMGRNAANSADLTLLYVTGTDFISIGADSASKIVLGASNSTIGFFGGAGTKPTVTGAKGGNVALGSLLSALSGLGMLTDSSTA